MAGAAVRDLTADMSLLRHAIIAWIYSATAIAVALTLPHSVPGMEKWTAVAIGAMILIFGAVLHETYARQEREKALKREIATLAASRDAVLDELSRARAEARAIHDKLAERPDSARVLDKVNAELRVLHGLVERLTAGARPPGAAPPPPRLATEAMAEADILALVRDAVRADRIDVALQPIVSLPQRKPRHFEAFSRLRNVQGAYMMPSQYRALAERAGLSAVIDNILLFRCIQLIRDTMHQQRSRSWFANLSIHTLRDAAFMEQLVDFMSDNPELAPRLVFEFGMDALREALPALRSPLDRLAGLGFRFSLDEVHHLARLDVEALEQNHIRFVKIGAARLLAEQDDPAQGLDVAAVKRDLDRAAIDLIVDGILDEAMLIEVLDLPIDFGQGPLFGEPSVA